VKKNTDFLNVKTICKFGTCSQVCIEKRHGNSNYSCKCIEGYHKVERSNKTSTCLVNDTHFLTMIAYRSELSFFPTLDEAQKQNQISSHSHLDSNLPKVTSFDFLISNNQTLNIFCLNSIPSNALERIDLKVEEYRNFNYTKIRSTFLIEQSKKVVLKALSVDWITSKIYFVGDDLIKTMEIDGSKVRTIIDAGMKSWDIIVDPSETRQIFWSTSMREIYVASMDGSHRRLFLKKDIEFVYGFALDVPAKRLYWCDIKRSTIESVNLDGTDRQLVSKFETQNINEDLLTNPIKLDVFEDEIYFVMTDKNLYRINKFGKNLMLVKQTNNTLQASNIKIVHSVRQLSVKLNPCLENPCDKSAICYLSSTDPSGRSCNCPDNNFIQKNGSYVECLEKTSNPSLCYKKCANGGKCKFQSDKMICECSAKFEGEFCQNYICSGYCLNRGVCVLPDEKVYKTEVPDFVLKDKRICICPKDWGGLRCETPRMVCNVSLLFLFNYLFLFHLSKHNQTNTYYLKFEHSQKGLNFKFLISFQKITCLNGGTCLSIPRDGFNNEMCSCPTNFSGSRCQNCAAKECFNGGSCILDSDVYKCSCPDGFSG
jgi:low-density lipoprotein receptor-related protein 1 (alpha-2-macroglobulin receptor)